MVIHSVAPLALLQEQPAVQATMRVREIEGGLLEGCDTPQGFQTARLLSTDPMLYLRDEYAPGSILGPR